MTQMTEQGTVPAQTETDLVAAVQRVLADSPEPLTPSKIRAELPSALRPAGTDELTEVLRRQVAANVLYQYPRYRSQQDRFWDRPMPVHVVALLRAALEEGPLAWSDLRRKLPAYATAQAETVLAEQVAQGLLHRHPPLGKRGGERYGVRPPDPRDYLRPELTAVFHRLTPLGFSLAQLREAALELLHEEEWSAAPETQAPAATPPQAQAPAAPPSPADTPLAEGDVPPSPAASSDWQ